MSTGYGEAVAEASIIGEASSTLHKFQMEEQ